MNELLSERSRKPEGPQPDSLQSQASLFPSRGGEVESELRIGLIGAARVATYAIIDPARRVEGVRIIGVAARDPERAKAYAAAHEIGRTYDSYADLLQDPEINLVYVATPPSRHADQALAAIAAGKAVLVEKPFSMTSVEAERVSKAAERAGVPVFEAMHSPRHRLFARVLQIVRSGEIGRVRHMVAEFDAPIDEDDPIRWDAGLGGGALMDLGVYPLAWCRRICGEAFTVTHADAEMRRGVDARFSAKLAFADGATAMIRSSMIAPCPSARLVLEGDEGRMEVVNPLAPQLGHALYVSTAGTERSETVEGPGSHDAQLAGVRAVLCDGAPQPDRPDDYVHSMRAIERVRAALAAFAR